METALTRDEIVEVLRTPKKQKWYSKLGIALFIMTIPTVIYFFIFHYLPIGGLVIAFKDYNAFKGIFDSPWTSMAALSTFMILLQRQTFGRLSKTHWFFL